MFHALGQMRVTEDGDPVGIEVEHLSDGALNARLRLPWQPVHQVDVDRGYAVLTQLGDYAFGRREALLAPDSRLHRGVEVLHADRHPSDPSPREGRDLFRIHMPRVDFHGELGTLIDEESIAQRAGNLADVSGGENIGRTAAPVDVRHRVPAREDRGNAANLTLERAQVAGNGRIALGGLRVAPTI